MYKIKKKVNKNMFITFVYSKVESKSVEELALYSEGDSVDISAWESDSQSLYILFKVRRDIFLPLVLLGLYALGVTPDVEGLDAVSFFLSLTALNVVVLP